jgi:2-keto-4-pentenoate hydratase/2-oxohepta-3-ene-1,7-dioic acid hydratase in catechol pathway
MRIARVGHPRLERPVAITDDGTAYDLAGITDDIDGSFLAAGGIHQIRAALLANELPLFSIEGQRFGSPVARPGMLLCIGLNYRQHAIETGAEIPVEPILFMKATRCVVGPNDTVLVPRTSTKTDWEVELAVVIGVTAHYLDSPADAPAHIAGYAISNDLSERAFQLERGGQWVKGKSCDTFNPLGPFLVPASDVDPQNLEMKLWVNGELRQSSNTSDMIFDVNYLVWYVSQFMVLEPGDIINTGTPSGVALGLPGTPYLRAGDTVRLSIAGLGEQEQTIGAA